MQPLAAETSDRGFETARRMVDLRPRFLGPMIAAGLGAIQISDAAAADLRPKRASPVAYVASCRDGPSPNGGGFVIPGSDVCLRIYGQARFDYRLREQFFRATAPSGVRSTMQVGFDAISQTEWGPMRAVAQVSLVYRAGEQRNATAIRQGFAIDGDFGEIAGPPGALRGGSSELLYSGFVQAAGFTAGRTVSFFDPFFAPDLIGTAWRAAPVNVNLIGYSAPLGGGWTGSVSLEDPTTRRQPILNAARGRASFNYVGDPSNVFDPAGIGVPHVVGALQMERPWGLAKIAGVSTSIRAASVATNAAPAAKYGFAAIGALKINLPWIARGDSVSLLASYGEGAVQYSFATFQLGSTAIQNLGGAGWSFGDGAIDSRSGRLRLTKHAVVAAAYQHVWTPNLSSTLLGSWRRYDVPFEPVDGRDTQRDGVVWSLAANTIWTPLRGLSLALEAAYVVVDPKGRVPDSNRNADAGGVARIGCNAALSNCFSKSSDSNLLGHFRLIRDF